MYEHPYIFHTTAITTGYYSTKLLSLKAASESPNLSFK